MNNKHLTFFICLSTVLITGCAGGTMGTGATRYNLSDQLIAPTQDPDTDQKDTTGKVGSSSCIFGNVTVELSPVRDESGTTTDTSESCERIFFPVAPFINVSVTRGKVALPAEITIAVSAKPGSWRETTHGRSHERIPLPILHPDYTYQLRIETPGEPPYYVRFTLPDIAKNHH